MFLGPRGTSRNSLCKFAEGVIQHESMVSKHILASQDASENMWMCHKFQWYLKAMSYF